MLTHSGKSLPVSRTVFATAAFLFISLCAGAETRAGLANLVKVQDNPTRAVIMLDHSAAGGVITISGGLTNWDLVVSQFDGVDGLVGISISGQHEISGQPPPMNVPHQGDVNPNLMLPIGILPPLLIPGRSVTPLTVIGPVPHPANHFDWLQFTYTPLAAGTARLTIQLDHTTDMNRPPFIPEPTTILLLGTGLAGCAIKMRKKLQNRKSG